MQSLDNLVDKILTDADQRAAALMADAEAQCAALRARREAEADAEAGRMAGEAGRKAAQLYDRLVAEQRLIQRDRVITAKGELLDRVFAEALARLGALPREAFLDYVRRALLAAEVDGEALQLPPGYGPEDIDALNAHLVAHGKRGNLLPDGGDSRPIAGGFVLRKDGIAQNNTFEALLGFYRHSLEAEVRSQLF